MKLEGKTALITGASRNIGRAIALAFAAEGADLVLNTRANGDELDAVAGACRKAGVRVVRALADVADATAVDTMVTRALAELGAIDVLVCNAAIRPHKPVTETSVDDWHRVMAVNLHSAFYLARAVVPGICLAIALPGDQWMRLSSAAAALAEYQLSDQGPLLRTSALAALPEPIRHEMVKHSDRVSDRRGHTHADPGPDPTAQVRLHGRPQAVE